MLKNFQKLNRENLKKINGGDEPNYGYCPDTKTYIPCDQLCQNRRNPLCALG